MTERLAFFANLGNASNNREPMPCPLKSSDTLIESKYHSLGNVSLSMNKRVDASS